MFHRKSFQRRQTRRHLQPLMGWFSLLSLLMKTCWVGSKSMTKDQKIWQGELSHEINIWSPHHSPGWRWERRSSTWSQMNSKTRSRREGLEGAVALKRGVQPMFFCLLLVKRVSLNWFKMHLPFPLWTKCKKWFWILGILKNSKTIVKHIGLMFKSIDIVQTNIMLYRDNYTDKYAALWEL